MKRVADLIKTLERPLQVRVQGSGGWTNMSARAKWGAVAGILAQLVVLVLLVKWLSHSTLAFYLALALSLVFATFVIGLAVAPVRTMHLAVTSLVWAGILVVPTYVILLAMAALS